MTRIYVAGPMTGLPDHNLPAFEYAAQRLNAKGHYAINPGRYGVIDGYEWGDYMRDAITDLLTCEAVAVLPGWHDSKGARLEVCIAIDLDMPVESIDLWLADDKGDSK